MERSPVGAARVSDFRRREVDRTTNPAFAWMDLHCAGKMVDRITVDIDASGIRITCTGANISVPLVWRYSRLADSSAPSGVHLKSQLCNEYVAFNDHLRYAKMPHGASAQLVVIIMGAGSAVQASAGKRKRVFTSLSSPSYVRRTLRRTHVFAYSDTRPVAPWQSARRLRRETGARPRASHQRMAAVLMTESKGVATPFAGVVANLLKVPLNNANDLTIATALLAQRLDEFAELPETSDDSSAEGEIAETDDEEGA